MLFFILIYFFGYKLAIQNCNFISFFLCTWQNNLLNLLNSSISNSLAIQINYIDILEINKTASLKLSTTLKRIRYASVFDRMPNYVLSVFCLLVFISSSGIVIFTSLKLSWLHHAIMYLLFGKTHLKKIPVMDCIFFYFTYSNVFKL